MKCREFLDKFDIQLEDDELLDLNILFANKFFGCHFPTYKKPKKCFKIILKMIQDDLDLDSRITKYDAIRFSTLYI